MNILLRFFLLCTILLISSVYAANTDSLLKQSVAITGISKRDLLGVQSADQQLNRKTLQSIHILALRVMFQIDSIATTSGDGSFDLSTTSEESLNPPPHNRMYFENQLKALSHYFASVSGNKLMLTFEVFPQGEEDSYQLPHDMKYYSGAEDENVKLQRWSELLSDAVAIADNSDLIQFSNYHSCFVFHAGVGADYSFDFDPTPYDIQSAFIDFSTLQSTVGANNPDYQGIPVNNGSYFIQDGLILPETENQEDYEIGMLGTMTLLFGAQLGLPSLMDTDTGRPGIGRWGLMDQGSANLQGLVPAQPCTWSKLFLGWEEPVVVRGGAQMVEIAAALAENKNKIVKVPINSKEYFLLENRQRDINGDEKVRGYDSEHNRIEILEDGRLLPVGWSGTIVSIDEYDFGLPGSGILLWHIDETIIENTISDNRINADISHRGVKLVECDAAQDIGHYYGWPLFGYDAGDYWDPWWSENESHMVANESESVAFTPTTMPNSNAHSGANTYIYITDFSDLDSIMTVAIRSDATEPGFPQFTGTAFGNNSLTVTSIASIDDSAQIDVIVAASQKGEIFAWSNNGKKLINNADSTYYIEINGDTTWYPLALFSIIEDSILQSPVITDITGDDIPEILIASRGDSLIALTISDNNNDGRGERLFSLPLLYSVTADIVVQKLPDQESRIICGLQNGDVIVYAFDGQVAILQWDTNVDEGPLAGLALINTDIVATTETGMLCCINSDGLIKWQSQTNVSGKFNQPVVADFNGDGQQEAVFVLSDGTIRCFNSEGSEITTPFLHSFADVLTYPAVGDVDNDGLPEVVFADRYGVRAFDFSGVVVTDFSIPYETEIPPMTTPSSPVIGDLDGDGCQDILLYIPDKYLAIIKPSTYNIEAQQFSVGAAIKSTPALYDLVGDGDVEIIALSDDGFLNIWNSAVTYSTDNFPWPQHRGDALHQASLTLQSQYIEKTGKLFVEKSVYCYPNPTEGDEVFIRYQLVEQVNELSVQIYDLIGEQITEFEGTTYVASDNEIAWNLAGVSTGVYFARVAAKSDNMSQVEIIKIAVVK